MKVGRGLSGLMSKSHRKCTSYGGCPFLFTAALIVMGLVLVLAGCGELSLAQLLENEEPGELSISPMDAFVPATGTLDISGNGGFTPYTYENKGTLGSIDPDTGVFTAPASVSGSFETTDVEITDSLGHTALTTITVFAPISLSPAVKTISEGVTVDFTVWGGVPNYEFYLNGNPEGSSSGNWSYAFPTEGSYIVETIDSLGNTAVAIITVEGNLAIDMERNWVVKLGSINVTVVNPTGAHTLSTDPPGVGSFDDDTAVSTTYHAPDAETVVTMKVEDSASDTATIDLHVLSSAPEPLAFPATMTVYVNAKDVQLTATGGIEPHTFWLVGEGSLSSHPTQEHRIRYNAPSFPTTAYVWVQDLLGRQAKTTICVVAY